MEKFAVSFDPQAQRLNWTMRGFWSMDDVTAFAAAMLKVIESLGPPPQIYDAMSDASEFPVQSTEVSDALGHLERVGRTMQQGRCAIIVSSMMNKLQAQRTSTGPNIRIFLDREEAEAWLESGKAA